jgi:hypothetical protein
MLTKSDTLRRTALRLVQPHPEPGMFSAETKALRAGASILNVRTLLESSVQTLG